MNQQSSNNKTLAEIFDNQIIHIKRGRLNKFGFEPAWNSYFDLYLSSKYLKRPILKLEDITFHLFLRKNLNDNDPTWKMPSMRMMKQRLGVGQNRIEAMLERLTKAHLLKKVSGKGQGNKGENISNTYELSDPIQELDEFLIVAANGEFPAPLKKEWEKAVTPPVPDSGTPPVPEMSTPPVPKLGRHKHTSNEHTSTTDVVVEKKSKKEDLTTTVAAKKQNLVIALTDRGLTKTVAQRLVSRYKQDRISKQIEYHDFEMATKADEIKSPPGRLRRRIEEDWQTSAGYKSRAEREVEALEEKRRVEQRVMAEKAREEQQRAKVQEQEEKRSQQLLRWREQYGTSDRELDLWPKVLEALQLQMTKATFDTWLAKSQLLKLQDGKVTIGVANGHAKDWVENRLKNVVQRTLGDVSDSQITTLEVVDLSSDKDLLPF